MNKIIYCFPKSVFENSYVPLGKSHNIQCQRKLLNNKRLSDVVNEDTLSALNNYAKSKNATFYMEDLGNDMFNDVAVHVYKSGVDGKKSFMFDLKNAKEDFANCMRTLYKSAENAIKELGNG